jgi:menaquinone-dependent protoporphyrinogen oxidase
MKCAILYASTHGAAREAAEFLQATIKNADVFDIKKNNSIDLSPYDTVIVGGSIHAGRVQGAVRKILKKEAASLLTKRLGLFLCCMYEADVAAKQFEEAFPGSLRNHAVALGLFGGKFDLDKMGFMARVIVKKIAGVTKSISKMNHAAMETFAAEING